MIVCVCNNIKESDLQRNPFLINVVGTKCGICIKNGQVSCGNETYIVDQQDRVINYGCA